LSADELSRDTLAELETLADDEALVARLRAVTAGRVKQEIISAAGARALRLLAGVLVEDRGLSPQEALDEIFDYISVRIGNRPDAWLNSLKLVALRVAGGIAAGDQGLISETGAMLEQVRAADRANVLDAALFRQPRDFRKLIKTYGETALDVIQYVLTRAVVDGKDPGSIKAWSYFEGPLADALEMQDGPSDQTDAGSGSEPARGGAVRLTRRRPS
jgi:hypothetical protein